MVALGLCLCVLALSLLSCGANPHGKTVDAETVVGTVDGKDVYYDELYFLASNYASDDIDAEELKNTVYKNIIENYAILALCEKAGVT